jgi:hypothetical protein
MPRKAYLALAVAACLLGGCSRPSVNVKYRLAVALFDPALQAKRTIEKPDFKKK